MRNVKLHEQLILGGKNQWIETKLKLDLYLSIAKQCTIHQMNICKQREKKSGKMIIRDIFGYNFGKNQWIETKLKLDLYLSIAKQCTKYQMSICMQREKKVRKTDNSFKGHNSFKNMSIATIFEVDHIKPCTKF
jgi:hypothetical protein